MSICLLGQGNPLLRIFSSKQNPTNSSKSVKKQALPNSSWSRYSCCRREVNFQIKERRISRRSREIKTGSCNWNYCPNCVDTSSECPTHSLDKCSQTSPWFTFMAVKCPRRCSICRRSQVCKRPMFLYISY
ncbi:uncharacterized protein LOC144748296 [Ciona intestinalis]